ncbi:hypothetical protein [Actinokineospora diospyrosa]|uniref:hypothetical protein n=1 Tax=Actinokineospora diospyrosa TaxID=103728 RepID=UPI0020A5F8B1|nr:hypothetical protein [Actinokineospora diospyrosa]
MSQVDCSRQGEVLAHELGVISVFGGNARLVSSVGSVLDRTARAASGFGAIAAVLGIAGGFMLRRNNFQEPDPALGGIDPVPNVARAARLDVVQNNGLAFGGNNAIAVLGRVA